MFINVLLKVAQNKETVDKKKILEKSFWWAFFIPNDFYEII